MALIINFSEEKMFMQGDFDVNSVQRSTGSLKEALKQTMLNQEVIFKKQVDELHRLYRVQITLMEDLGCKDFGRHNSRKESTHSSLMPHTNAIRYEPQQKEPRFSSISMVGSVPPIRQDLLEGCQGMHCKLQQMPFDFQVPANLYISCADNDFPEKKNASNHLKNTLESHVNNVSGAMDLTLSLSLGVDSRRREGKKRSWFNKETHSHNQFFIDLEDSTEGTSRGNAEQEPSIGCTSLITYTGGKDESQVSVLSNLTIPRSIKKDESHEIAVSSFLVDDGECCQERHSSNQEIKESQADIPCNHMPIKKQQKLASYDVRHLDLNKVQLDDLSCNLSDPMVAYPSASSSLVGLPEIVGRDKLSGIGETESSPAGLKSIFRLPMDLSEYHGSCCSDPNNRDKLTSELHGCLLNDLNHTCVSTRQVSCVKSEVEDTECPCSGQSQDKHAALCKACCIVDNVSSSIKTLQSGIESGNSSIPAVDQFSGTHVQSQTADILSGEQDRRSCGNSEHGCAKKKEESAEVDVLIQRAAESLIHFSLEKSACFQDSTTRSSGSNEIENDETDQPQNSSDSFELITLKLRESSSEDYCVSSKPFEVNDADKRDFGIKLTRGRRLKDFKKDILPGLASLSSHEIWEDINILEGVLRSKEYRKNNARIADGESWSLPLRSRRKRLNYLQRRKFS